MFLRAPPERRAPVRGAVDRNLLGHGFFDNNKERLLALKMNCLVTQGRVVSFITLRLNTGLPFDAVTYMNLVTAGNFAIKKYANKNGSDGTCNSISWLLNQVRRGSKRFRRTMEKNVISKVISELRVVNTFFDIIQVEKPDRFTLSILYSSWSWTFLSNRFRTFCFQYVNNSLGIKTRIAARYRNRNVVLDDSCTFCLKKNVRNPSRETFMHLFYECPCIIMLRQRILEIFFPTVNDAISCRSTYFTGIVEGQNGDELFFNIMTALTVNFVVWQGKQKKIIPSLATVLEEVDNLFASVVNISENLKISASNCGALVCRRWREKQHGRG
jgi:hypothetical protein